MSQYQSRLIAESIRIIENDSPVDSFHADYSQLSFESALMKRTKLAELRYQVAPVLAHLKQSFNRFTGLVCLVFLIIGATSVSHFLVNDAGTQINFFWAMLLFIMPNLLSLLIWSILFFKKMNLNLSWVAHLSLSGIGLLDKLQHKLTNKHPYYINLFQFYFEHLFSSSMGKVQLSFISHLWWGCYLFGATCSLLLVLATHQVDFIWETTILSADVFAQLTHLLTILPNAFGVSVPHSTDVTNASISIVNSLEVAQLSRISWSNLLIFSLTVYGLLPRIFLMLIFKQQVGYQQKKFSINILLPYYVQLKSLLQPIGNKRFISDPDLPEKPIINEMSSGGGFYNEDFVMPKDAYPLAIELNTQCFAAAQEHVAKYYSINLINMVDSKSQQQCLSALTLSGKSNIILYADLQRAPDRGWLSLVNQCRYNNSATLYLVLLGGQPIKNDPKRLARLQDWIEAATKAHINTSCITYVLHDTDKKEV